MIHLRNWNQFLVFGETVIDLIFTGFTSKTVKVWKMTTWKSWQRKLKLISIRLMALFPGLPGWAGTRKEKPIWILLKQETVGGSDISWAICKSASRSRQITTPAPHHSVFYRPDALPAAQPTASEHWRKIRALEKLILITENYFLNDSGNVCTNLARMKYFDLCNLSSLNSHMYVYVDDCYYWNAVSWEQFV